VVCHSRFSSCAPSWTFLSNVFSALSSSMGNLVGGPFVLEPPGVPPGPKERATPSCPPQPLPGRTLFFPGAHRRYRYPLFLALCGPSLPPPSCGLCPLPPRTFFFSRCFFYPSPPGALGFFCGVSALRFAVLTCIRSHSSSRQNTFKAIRAHPRPPSSLLTLRLLLLEGLVVIFFLSFACDSVFL